MSSAEDGYCSADSPRADSAADEPMAAAEESPRAGAGQSKRERDIPSPSSPLPAAKRRYQQYSSVLFVSCVFSSSGTAKDSILGLQLSLHKSGLTISFAVSSRRSVEKRVVSVRIGECGDRAKGASGEGPPPADSWAWRKYGQKPIKGSPYPRGYYRCSSSKGCPARKQVERSRADPTLLLVTYTFEHNHASPQPKTGGGCHQSKQASPRASAPKPEPVELPAEPEAETGPEHVKAEEPEPEVVLEPKPEPEQEEKVAVTLVEPAAEVTTTVAPAADEEEESFDFGWFDQYPTWHRPALYTSAPTLDAAPLLPPEEWERELQGEDALFAGLGELPECAFVFGRRRELSLAAATTAPCS